jgi:hypothetical protein
MTRGIKNNIQDLWNFVDKSGECWIWLGRKDKDGYGEWWLDGKNVKAHRVAVELDGRKIEKPSISRHLCNQRNCVNPKHIVAGTQKENVQDQLRFGTHSRLKYSDEIIQKIKTEYAKGNISQRGLAEKYGLGKSQVGLIVTNKTRIITKEKNG